MRKLLPLILFGSAVTALAVGAGYYLAPSNKEIALMQMDDRDFKLSLKTFSDLYAAGDHSINVVSPLVKLNIHYGDIDRAIKIL